MSYLDTEFMGTLDTATLTQNNLGGLGPDSGAAEVYIVNAGIAVIAENETVHIDLLIENMSEHTETNPSRNGLSLFPFGNFNVACGSETVLRFTFLLAGSNRSPVTFKKAYFTFYDLDSGNEGIVREYVGGENFVQEYLNDPTELAPYSNYSSAEFNGTAWISTSPGNGLDNPEHPLLLTSQQRQRTITLEYANVSFIDALFGLTYKPTCKARNLMFGFKTSLVPHECETCAEGSDGDLSCCAPGGSWRRMCGTISQFDRGIRQYTYVDGKAICTTPAPTPSPPPPPEDRTTPAPTLGNITGVSDPHMKNALGESFDIKRLGQHEFLRVPRESASEAANFTVTAKIVDWADSIDECAAVPYIQSLRFGGLWLEHHGVDVEMLSDDMVVSVAGVAQKATFEPLSLGADVMLSMPRKGDLTLRVGSASIGVVRDAQENHFFLDFHATSLKSLGYSVGGLLGEDAHTEVDALPSECSRLFNTRGHKTAMFSASGSMA
jgi:hypothetical protein